MNAQEFKLWVANLRMMYRHLPSNLQNQIIAEHMKNILDKKIAK